MNESSDKSIIAELRLLNGQLSSELFEVNQRLKESEAFKSHFISNITNEILNPFSSILALSENITSLGKEEIEQAKRMARLIHQEAFQLDFQLKNIFAAAITEAGLDGLRPVSVNPADLIRKAIRFFEQETRRRQLELELKTDDRVPGKQGMFLTDELKLELIVKNLLSNAIKFSPPNGKIELLLTIDEGRLNLIIRDFGKGIPQQEYKAIFDRFKQLDESIHTENTGQGLGLSIVKAYLLVLEGTIELSNPDEGGLKVMIGLPELCLPDPEDDLGGFLFNTEERF